LQNLPAMGHLSALPQEILEIIWSYESWIKDIDYRKSRLWVPPTSLQLVCRKWNQLLQDIQVRHNQNLRHHPPRWFLSFAHAGTCNNWRACEIAAAKVLRRKRKFDPDYTINLSVAGHLLSRCARLISLGKLPQCHDLTQDEVLHAYPSLLLKVTHLKYPTCIGDILDVSETVLMKNVEQIKAALQHSSLPNVQQLFALFPKLKELRYMHHGNISQNDQLTLQKLCNQYQAKITVDVALTEKTVTKNFMFSK